QPGGRPGSPPPLGAWWGSAWGRRHEGSGASVVRPRSGGSYDPSGVEQLGRGRGVGVTDYSDPVGAEPAGEDMGDQRPGADRQALAAREAPITMDVDLDLESDRGIAVVLQMHAYVVETGHQIGIRWLPCANIHPPPWPAPAVRYPENPEVVGLAEREPGLGLGGGAVHAVAGGDIVRAEHQHALPAPEVPERPQVGGDRPQALNADPVGPA